MLDVAAVATRLLERSSPLRCRFAGLLGVRELDAVPVVAALVAMHDIGKVDVRFALKAPEVAARLDPRWAGLGGSGPYDHGAWGYVHARDDRRLVEPFGAPDQLLPLFQAVAGHHGTLPSTQPPRSGSAGADLVRRFRTDDAGARSTFAADVARVFRERGASLPLSVNDDFSSAAVVLLAGLCSVADWVGSQVEFFPYVSDPMELADYLSDRALPQADAALDAAGLTGAAPSGQKFHELFPGCTPRDVQLVTEALEMPPGPSLVILEAQMGSGKTEAALSLAERFLARDDATRLFIGLPTQATANGMLDRIDRVADRLFDGRVQLRLAHGQSRRHPAFQRLVEGKRLRALEDADGDEAQVVCARWFLSRKRALLADIGVGTVDQAMQAAIRVKHHFVRTFALASSVVVVDEVHAYDAYMEVILERLTEWLGALGAPLILLSATLPAERRHSLGEAYRRGAGWAALEIPVPMATAAYPLVTVVAQSGVSTHALGEAPPSRELLVERLESSDPAAVVLPRLADAVARGAMVAWIRNTVGDAQEAYDRAREIGLSPTLFHARFRPVDRARIEGDVLARCGPGGARLGALVIATQVVEQSLDLDFDLLFSDLAPIDLLLQRAGRLWRHERPRPEGCDRRLVVVEPGPHEVEALHFGRSGRVYDVATLWLAHDSLAERGTVALPAAIRPLVEATYDPDRRRSRIAAAPNRAALEGAEARRSADLARRQDAAESVCIPPVTFEPRRLATFDDDEEEVRALTRDGESERVLLVDWSPDGTARSIDGAEWATGLFDPERPDGWRTAAALADEIVSFPAWEWDLIERGSRPRGEHAEWASFESQLLDFLERTGLGRVVPVPGRMREEGFIGHVERARGTRQRVTYSRDRGLEFAKEG